MVLEVFLETECYNSYFGISCIMLFSAQKAQSVAPLTLTVFVSSVCLFAGLTIKKNEDIFSEAECDISYFVSSLCYFWLQKPSKKHCLFGTPGYWNDDGK